MSNKSDDLLRELANILGEQWVSDDPEIIFPHTRDVNLGPKDLDSIMRPPFYVAIPGTPEELQKVMMIARRYKAPITILATGINICGIAVPPMGGILVDLKRLDKIVSIDEANGTATIQPYVTIARLSCELQKKGLYIPVPGCPSTAGLISNILFGMGLKVANRVGRQDESIVGFKMILPDGNIIKVGSGADPMVPKDFWPWGPGPAMHFLPMYTCGTTGIVFEMTVKCWLRGENYKELWVGYEDIDQAGKAAQKLARMDIAKGLNIYSGNKYTSYFTDTREAMERMIRANPEFTIICSLEGTERRIAFEEKTIRKVAAETGGRVLADKLPPYESFTESHAGMSGSFFSDYSMRYWGSRGTNWTTSALSPAEQHPDQFKAFTDAVLADAEYSDPDFGHGEFWRGLIVYPYSGGHYTLQENGIDVHPGDPTSQSLAMRLGASYPMAGMKRRVLLPPFSKAPREGLPPYRPVGYRVTRELVKRLDPLGYLHSGVVFNY